MKKLTTQLLCSLLFIAAFFASSCNSTFEKDLSKHVDIVVASDGSGDYETVMEAIAAAPSDSPDPVLIYIKNGLYHEKIIVPNDKPNLVFFGEDMDSTILSYNDRSVYTVELNTFTSHSVRVDASNVSFYNLTIRNPETGSQAVALHGNGDKQMFIHCRITGWQDTYYIDMRARNYFKDCFIEGATDFIFGFGIVVFDSCHINTLGRYVTAASTPEQYKFGMVFRDCKITAKEGLGSYSLGRPWFDYARTVFMHCYESEGLSPEGWSAWGERQNTCFYREYKCYGPGSDTANRVFFGKQLTDKEAEEYTLENIYGAGNYPTGDEDYSIYLEKRFVGHKNEPYLEYIVFRADGEWPEKPAEDWIPAPERDPWYKILYAYAEPLLK